MSNVYSRSVAQSFNRAVGQSGSRAVVEAREQSPACAQGGEPWLT